MDVSNSNDVIRITPQQIRAAFQSLGYKEKDSTSEVLIFSNSGRLPRSTACDGAKGEKPANQPNGFGSESRSVLTEKESNFADLGSNTGELQGESAAASVIKHHQAEFPNIFPTIVEVYWKTGDLATYLPHPRQKIFRLFHLDALHSLDTLKNILKNPWSDSLFSYRYSSDVVVSEGTSTFLPPPPKSVIYAIQRHLAVLEREIGDLNFEKNELERRLKQLCTEMGEEHDVFHCRGDIGSAANPAICGTPMSDKILEPEFTDNQSQGANERGTNASVMAATHIQQVLDYGGGVTKTIKKRHQYGFPIVPSGLPGKISNSRQHLIESRQSYSCDRPSRQAGGGRAEQTDLELEDTTEFLPLDIDGTQQEEEDERRRRRNRERSLLPSSSQHRLVRAAAAGGTTSASVVDTPSKVLGKPSLPQDPSAVQDITLKRLRGNQALWSIHFPNSVKDPQEEFGLAYSFKPSSTVMFGHGFVVLYDDGDVYWHDICPLLESKIRQQGLESVADCESIQHDKSGGPRTKVRYIVLGSESNFYVKFDNGRMEWCGQDSFGNSLRKGVSEKRLAVHRVAFGEEGGWLIIWSDGSFEAERMPTTLIDRLQRQPRSLNHVSTAGSSAAAAASSPRVGVRDIQDVTVGPNGEWFVINKDHSVQADNLPESLHKTLIDIRERSGRVRAITFGEDRSWFVRYWDPSFSIRNRGTGGG